MGIGIRTIIRAGWLRPLHMAAPPTISPSIIAMHAAPHRAIKQFTMHPAIPHASRSHLRYTSPVTRKAPKPLRSVSAWSTKEVRWSRRITVKEEGGGEVDRSQR